MNAVRSSPTASLVREGKAEEAQLPHLEHGLDREHLVAVPVGCERSDLGSGEVTHHRPELLLLLVQVIVHTSWSHTHALHHLVRHWLPLLRLLLRDKWDESR